MERADVRRIVETVVDRLTPPGEGARAESAAAAPSCSSETGRARWVEWGAPATVVIASPPKAVAVEAAPTPAAAPPPAIPAPAGDAARVVAIGADHGAFQLKQSLLGYLREELGWQVLDLGTDSEEPVDYPDLARDVAVAVASGRAARGIVLDAMGIGSAMAANRVPGALCAVCHDAQTARNAREHNDANVLSMGSKVVGLGQARQLVRLFLTTPHAGGRHARRVSKIRALDAARVPGTRGTG